MSPPVGYPSQGRFGIEIHGTYPIGTEVSVYQRASMKPGDHPTGPVITTTVVEDLGLDFGLRLDDVQDALPEQNIRAGDVVLLVAYAKVDGVHRYVAFTFRTKAFSGILAP